MKLIPWLLGLHLVALAIACGIAMNTDCDGTRLMAWGLAMLIAGWGSILSSIGYVVWRAARKQLSARDVAVALVLICIGLVEKGHGLMWHDHIRNLPGWSWAL